MSIVRKRRPKQAGRRLDLTSLREAIRDGRTPLAAGIVKARNGSFYEIDGEDVLVEVELVPSGRPVTCRMGMGGMGNRCGLWFVPEAGVEVAVAIPDGEQDASPMIVGILSPELPDGVGPGVVVIAAPSKVYIHDGTAGTDKLVKATPYAAHVHPTAMGMSSPPDNANSAATYTEILEAK